MRLLIYFTILFALWLSYVDVSRATNTIVDGSTNATDEEVVVFTDMTDFMPQEVADPIEPVNRVMFNLNDKLYYWFLKPIATGYSYVLPYPIRQSIDNLIYNTLFPIRFANSLLQFRIDKAGYEILRFFINLIMGIGGLADAAYECFGLGRDFAMEDMGQTLGYWGVSEVAFLYLPFYGPSSVRDTAGDIVDAFFNPLYYAFNFWTFLGVDLFYRFNKLSLDLDFYDEIKRESFDPYIAFKNYYVNYRRNLIRR